MIITLFYKQREDGIKLFKTYSDEGYLIQKEKTDELYDEAIDIEGSNYCYIETNEKMSEEDFNIILEDINYNDDIDESDMIALLKEVF